MKFSRKLFSKCIKSKFMRFSADPKYFKGVSNFRLKLFGFPNFDDKQRFRDNFTKVNNSLVSLDDKKLHEIFSTRLARLSTKASSSSEVIVIVFAMAI